MENVPFVDDGIVDALQMIYLEIVTSHSYLKLAEGSSPQNDF